MAKRHPPELRARIFELAQKYNFRYSWVQSALFGQDGVWIHADTIRGIALSERKRQGGEPTWNERRRDSQRQRLYRWERRFMQSNARMTIFQCDLMVKQAYAVYGLEWKGSTRPGRSDARTARGSAERVTLPPWARQPAVVLHEAAHGIAHTIGMQRKLTLAPHGPEFARIMIELWAALDFWPISAVLLDTGDVKFAGDEWTPEYELWLSQSAAATEIDK